ncbi:hypothetical protein [Moorena producens]|nr:hypothetical protein [Moorena producens]
MAALPPQDRAASLLPTPYSQIRCSQIRCSLFPLVLILPLSHP